MENKTYPKKKIFLSEHTIQLESIGWYRNEFQRKGLGVIIPVPNELAAKRKDVEICIGASDTIIVHGGKVIFVEFKTGYNTQSPHQISFQKLVESLGYPYHICRSLTEFKSLIEKYKI